MAPNEYADVQNHPCVPEDSFIDTFQRSKLAESEKKSVWPEHGHLRTSRLPPETKTSCAKSLVGVRCMATTRMTEWECSCRKLPFGELIFQLQGRQGCVSFWVILEQWWNPFPKQNCIEVFVTPVWYSRPEWHTVPNPFNRNPEILSSMAFSCATQCVYTCTWKLWISALLVSTGTWCVNSLVADCKKSLCVNWTRFRAWMLLRRIRLLRKLEERSDWGVCLCPSLKYERSDLLWKIRAGQVCVFVLQMEIPHTFMRAEPWHCTCFPCTMTWSGTWRQTAIIASNNPEGTLTTTPLPCVPQQMNKVCFVSTCLSSDK